MPLYGSIGRVPAIYPGDVFSLFLTEQPATGQMSQQVCIADLGAPASLALEFEFAGAPGAFEFDIVQAGEDYQTNYVPVPVGSVVNTVGAAGQGLNHARVDLSPFVGPFLAVFCKTQNANAVNVTVRVIRI